MAKNQEKYRSLDIGRFSIRDSIEHIPSSLEALVNDLRKDASFTFPLLNQFDPIKNLMPKKKLAALKMLKKKGVYPYEYFKNFKSLQTTKKFPPQAAFYSNLNEAHISEEEYKNGKKVFGFFKCRNMEEYMRLYNALDVILLAEVFTKYREMVIHHFELDPIYYLGNRGKTGGGVKKKCIICFFLFSGIPGLSFDVMLKMFYEEDHLERRGKDSSSNDEDRPLGALDLFDDPSMEQFFSRGVRGGQSFIATREAEGNDNPETAGDHLLYVDGKIDKKSFCLKQKYGKKKKKN